MVWDAVVKKDPKTGKPANYLITKVEDVVPIMHKAVEVALTGRPGPVQVAVAWNITAPALQVTNYSPPRVDRRPVAPDPAGIESAAAFLAEAIAAGKQTVLWAGYGAIRAGAGPEVRAFMERYQVPLVTTMDGKGIVAEDHPLAMGLFCELRPQIGLGGVSRVRRGDRARQLPLPARHVDFRPDLFENRKLVCINVDPEENDKYYKADYGIVGDASWPWRRSRGAGRPRRAGDAEIVRRRSTSRGWSTGWWTSPPTSIPGGWSRQSRACCRTPASSSPTSACIWALPPVVWPSRAAPSSTSRQSAGAMGQAAGLGV